MANHAEEILIPLSKEDLDLLEWFAQWTPEVYRAAWKERRAQPPGFRYTPDLSVYRSKREILDVDNHGDKNAFAKVRNKFLPFRLVEGTIKHGRLTPRGRALLKLHGRDCPDFFESHCPEIWDDFDLRPRNNRDFMENTAGSKNPVLDRPYQNLELLPDTPKMWRAMCVQYHADSYTNRGSASKASVRCANLQGTMYLNGSMRSHGSAVQMTVRNNEGRQVCKFMVSLEQFADVLTSQSETPCTLNDYFGADGVRRMEPAPRPVSAYQRMQERLKNVEGSSARRLRKIMEMVEETRMGKKAKAALLHELRIAADLQVKDAAFVAQETQEEVSKVLEGSLTLVSERMALAGVETPHNLLGPAAQALIEGEVIDVEEE